MAAMRNETPHIDRLISLQRAAVFLPTQPEIRRPAPTMWPSPPRVLGAFVEPTSAFPKRFTTLAA